uniref:C-type lectin domain-containing protein n=1 Tax=Ditylenchus dipsaci TaxID=166011 RepID=A0A915DBV5_9BILA
MLTVGALVSGVGIVSWLGHSINLLFFTSPLFTLVLIINAYDSFHIADVWSRLQTQSRRKQYTPSERLATTFEQIAPSYLTINVSLFVFSLTVSFALLFNFIYQTFISSAALALLCSDSELAYEAHFAKSIELKKPSIGCLPTTTNGNSKNGSSASKIKTNSLSSIPAKRQRFRQACAHKLFHPYTKFLTSIWTKVIALALLILIGWFGVKNGLAGLENRMDYRKMLPNGSPASRAFNLMDTIWMDILQIVYFVKHPPNFENATEFGQFKNFIFDASAIPTAMHPRAHMSWLFDYYRDQLDQNFFEIEASKQNSAINMSNFKEFITTFPYQAWQNGVKFSFEQEKKTPTIQSMVVLIAYNETKGLNGKYSLMAECRKVAAKYPNFDIVAFDTDSQTVDVIEAVPKTTLILVVCLIISTGVITQILLWNVFATVLTTATVSSIIAGLYGLGRLFGLELDLLSVPATTAVAAQVIHLGSQYMGEFISCWAKEERLRRALEFTSSPLWKTAIIWLIIAIPQLLSSVEFFSVQARILMLGIGLVACHVLVIVLAEEKGESFHELKYLLLAEDEEWTAFNGSYYKVVANFTYELNAELAQEICRNLNSSLVSIHSAEENQFISEFVSKYNTTYSLLNNFVWIGMQRLSGVLAWMDGSPMDFTNWEVNEPDNYLGQQNCVFMCRSADGCISQKNIANPWEDWYCRNISQTINMAVCKKSSNQINVDGDL